MSLMSICSLVTGASALHGSCSRSKGCAYALRQLRSSLLHCWISHCCCQNAHAAKDPLLLTSAKKHPTQFCFSMRLQCDPLNVTVNEIAAYLQFPALSTELTVFYPGSSLWSPSASDTWKCCSSHVSQVGGQQIPRGGPTRVSYVAVCTPSSSHCFV